MLRGWQFFRKTYMASCWVVHLVKALQSRFIHSNSWSYSECKIIFEMQTWREIVLSLSISHIFHSRSQILYFNHPFHYTKNQLTKSYTKLHFWHTIDFWLTVDYLVKQFTKVKLTLKVYFGHHSNKPSCRGVKNTRA